MKGIQFSTQLIQDQFIQLESSPDVSLDKLLPQVCNQLKGSGASQSVNDYKILIARQYSGNLDQTLQELNLQPGDCIILVQPLMTTVKLVFHLPNQRPQDGIIVTQQEILIGRRDESARIFPDLDLTPWLADRGRDPLKVSRQLAWMREKGGKWEISMHPDARSAVFVERNRLEPGKKLEIKDENVLSFGNHLESPELRIVVRLNVLIVG